MTVVARCCGSLVFCLAKWSGRSSQSSPNGFGRLSTVESQPRPSERAGYNLLLNLDLVKVPFPRVREKARKDIDEYSNFLEKNDENRLIPRDIGIRLLRALNDLLDFDRRLRELEGRDITAIIAAGLPNECVIFHFMNEYAKGATARDVDIHLIQLACMGMLQVATFAREAVTWHFGFEDVVLLALDIGSLGDLPPWALACSSTSCQISCCT